MVILHCADTHLGFRRYGLEQRAEDFAQAFSQIVDIAVEQGVDAVVHAGDLFERPHLAAEDLQTALRALARLQRAGIPFLGVVGNHEQRRGVQWLDLFADHGLAVHLGATPLRVGDWDFYGLDHSGRQGISLPTAEGGVLVAHQLLTEVVPHGELTIEQIARTGARCALLGDYHEHRSWRENGLLVTYSGSSERWSIEERAPRGVNVIDLDARRLDRRELRTRPFVYIRREEDPIKAMESYGRALADAVVVVYTSDASLRVREIEECGRRMQALTVRVVRPQTANAPEPAADYSLSAAAFDVDQLIVQRLASRGFDAVTRAIDLIVRDREVADSRVESEVAAALERASPQGRP